MTGQVDVVLQASVTVFGFDANVDLTLIGAPFSIRLGTEDPVNLLSVWNQLSDALEHEVGLGLPHLGAWSKILDADILPSLYIGPSGSNPKAMSIQLALDFVAPIRIGGSIDIGGGVTVSIEPNFSVWAIYIGHDAATGGLNLRARVTTPTTTPSGDAGAPKSQVVTYPFPVPAQDGAGTFKINYLGLGQRVGPTVAVTAADPMTAIFDQLESELKGDDPRSVLTTLAEKFYQPDRDWFIAADVEMKGFRIRVIFNDPTMYGLQITVAANSPTPFAGLLFEILYQKLSPNLGLYYGALTLPTLMRRIPLQGFVLILPGFAIWVYTNGDFRVNVGWPLGDNSIGISFEVLIGRAAFYFAKLRSGDNPGAQASVSYNPILAFGMGVSLSAGYAFNAGIFNATIAVTLSATFQGLLAWRDGNQVYAPPDHYWFAGTAGISVLIQGWVDFSVIRAAVTISFTANVGVAFETGYATLIAVSAEVRVEVKVKVVFFTIRLSFHTSVSSQFTIGSGPQASINGPLAPGLAIVGGFGTASLAQARALDLAERMIERRPVARRLRPGPGRDAARLGEYAMPGTPLRPGRAGEDVLRATAPVIPPAAIALSFLLQPTATYVTDPAFAVIASLVTDCPRPGVVSPPDSPSETSFERLVRAMVDWLLGFAPAGKLSQQFRFLATSLGYGGAPPFGDWGMFEAALRTFLAERCSFTVTGVDIDCTDTRDEGTVAVLPMFDTLELRNPDGTIVDFDRYGPTPPNYPVALNCYFQSLGGPAAAERAAAHAVRRAVSAADGSPAERSLASFLFLDYFLMQARNAVDALLPAAIAYEEKHKQTFLDAIDAADGKGRGAADPFLVTDLVAAFVDRVTGDAELDDLLAAFDYASAAGIGSRFLLGGLQLPIPGDVPPHPTVDNMAGVPTAPLFTLTGQQCAVAAGATATATLSLNHGTTLPAIPITFAGSPATSTAASFALPTPVPPSPSPTWHGVGSPALPGEGDLTVAWLPPVTPHPLYQSLKTQLAWAAPGRSATLLPLPDPLRTLLQARNGLRLAITPVAPPQGNGPPPPPPAPLGATAALQIRLSVSQVPVNGAAAVVASGSPVAASPSTNAVARQYLPHLYQLGGTDEATRDLIHTALLGDLSGARIALLYPATETVSPGGGSPDRTAAIMRSEALSPDVLLAKTNLSTLNQVPETGRAFSMMAERSAATATDLAPITDVPGFLRLVWELSVVNAPGFFLFYLTEDGADLPASIFASAGVSGGGTAELDVLVEWGSDAAPTVVPAFANAVVVDGSGIETALYAGVLDIETARPIADAAPSYPAGTLAFSVAWDRPEDDGCVPVGELYHLLQYAVAADAAYEGSVWSLPIGPAQNALPATFLRQGTEHLSHYVQSVPAAAVLRHGSGTPNRYGIIDRPMTIDLRIVDIYGNALPDSHSTTETPLYQDPLVALGEWPGLFVDYRVAAAQGPNAEIAIDLHFDPDAVVPPNGSPTSGIAPGRAQDAWMVTLDRYRLILDQLTDPNVVVTVTSSLLGDTAAGGAAGDGIVEAARRITEVIAEAIDLAHSPDEPVVAPVYRTIGLAVPFSAIRALKALVVPLTVSVIFARPPALVDPGARSGIPAAASVTYEVHPNLAGADVSPGASGNVMAFAEPFERAFADFDGAGGCLKLAQRAGVAVGPAGGGAALWATRWSATHGVSVRLDPGLVYFALAPLSTKPMTGTVGERTWSGIDLDAWARDFLTAFDAFLSPAFAVAIGVLDLRDGTSLFDQLTATKQRLAKAIKRGLTPLFTEQAAGGDLAAAQDRYEQAMLTALASAFNVTTIIQIPTLISTMGSTAADSPGVAPRLFGNIGSPDASPAAARSSPYSLSSGNLDLVAGDGWMTTLLTVAQAERQAELALPLDYQVSYLQHDFEPEDSYLGYVPSSWLKFAIPDAAPLAMPVTAHATLPIPLIFQPTAPILSLQTATAAPLASPTAGETAAEEIAAAMRWIYAVDIGLALASQDAFFFDVMYNQPVSLAARRMLAEEDPRVPLFESLAAFRSWYDASAGDFGLIPQAAFPVAGTRPATASPGTAGALIEGFQTHAVAVAAAWEAFHEPRPRRLARALDETTDHFYLVTAPAAGGSPSLAVTLFGRGDRGGPPGVWPTLTTADGQVWSPDGSPAAAGSPDGWFEVSHVFAEPPSLGMLRLAFGPLDILERQSAIFSARVVRNADLVDGLHTAEAFIYRTQDVRFPSPIVPLIQRGTLPPVTPGPSLVDTLIGILTPIAQVGGAFAPTLRLSAVYAYAMTPPLAGGASLMSRTAMTLVRGAAVTSPDALAASAARELADWFHESPRSTRAATLTFTITVFGTRGDTSLPLVQFDSIVVPTGDLPDTWWRESLP